MITRASFGLWLLGTTADPPLFYLLQSGSRVGMQIGRYQALPDATPLVVRVAATVITQLRDRIYVHEVDWAALKSLQAWISVLRRNTTCFRMRSVIIERSRVMVWFSYAENAGCAALCCGSRTRACLLPVVAW
ncbi:hypothetical protein HD554DRAFT_2056201 [Boletus coccyginus]|nr:hypothetical protein HD554DRAFT_2056201 [Boletus coccyginus]